MDHQVEHDADIGAAAAERGQAAGVDEDRVVDHRGIAQPRHREALQVADLQDDAAGVGLGDHGVGLFQRDGDRLLDQDMDAGRDAVARDREMEWRRRADADRVHLSRQPGRVGPGAAP